MIEHHNMDFMEYYSLFLRNKRFFFAPFILVFSLVSLSSLFFPKIYESSTVIKVQKPQPNPIETRRVVNEDLQGQLKTLQEMALSRPHLIETIRKLNLDKGMEGNLEMEKLIQSIRDGVSIMKKGAELFTVSFQDSDPERAMKITNTIVNLFIDESLSLKREEAFSSVDFIRKQLDIYKAKLEESEDALRKFKQEHIGEMPGQQNTNLVQLDRLRDTLAETNMAIQEAMGRKGFIEKQMSSESPMVVSMSTGEASSTGDKIKILEFQLSQFLANYTEKHPDVVRIKTELDHLRKEADAKQSKGSDPAPPKSGDLTTLNPLHQKLKEDYNNISITIGTLEAKKGALEKKIAEYGQKVVSIPSQEQQLAALQRDYNVNENIYDMLLRRYEEARISKYLEFSSGGTRFQVIDPAIVPLKPIKPNYLHFLAAGLASGCAAGIGLIFLKDYFDTSTRGVREAEEIYKVPVLSAIPVITAEREIEIRKMNRKRWIFGSVLFFILLIGAAVVAVFLR
ncbi:MAG: hypothetical protein CO150_04765 [Nitrospirae bacterium CG_4_9_14_3_um_filter_53_35]|nr:MAG: hypothetical protein AUK29_06530 [Nitrospirae bacterium CG2_30_53_67]PIS36635.1 MAG: hypothetical protein COT35_10140 [Nitrospirae bacterium CG08_land_8_20_14_0_20_52_24]PIV85653.1 MAG: hypothetical protein COW52_01135 [Nitrospirae bacterium CG17_big_fil_post_rev_8_21_14_2_50_50_9]PIW85178.1 MAG: hypothetical protein COZ95_05965 [Nitrospirae bacterium CG_4_8_14_3_um_filter_50_41]PIX86703.1 MAG: hypothetical protein COZ32_01995 [Nitrospirae bacterium CG_4_10_14_3_um_filter_53_41]PJA7542